MATSRPPGDAGGDGGRSRIEVVVRDHPSDDYVEGLARAGHESGFLQTGFWGAVTSALGRGEPLFFEARSEGVLLASLLAIRQRPRLEGPVRRLLGLVSGLGRGRLDFGEGPTIHVRERAPEGTAALLDAVVATGRRLGVRGIRCAGFPPSSRYAADPAIRRLFVERGFTTAPWGTFLCDLRPDEDELLRSLDHSARKGIKKAVREGLSVRRMETWEEFRDRFLLPYLSWLGEGAEAKVGLGEARIVWEQPGHDDYYRYWIVADEGGETLAVLGMYLCGGVATEIASGTSPNAVARKLPAQDLLHWEMFLDAKRLGCDTFNLAGVSPDPQTPKEENIRRFKKKWGGAYVEYDRYEWRHWTLRLAESLRRRLSGERPAATA